MVEQPFHVVLESTFGESCPVVEEKHIDYLLDILSEFAVALSHHERVLTVEMTLESSNPNSALSEAVKRWRKSLEEVELHTGKPTLMQVMPLSRHERELAEPSVPPLLGVAEVAEELGVSRQRVSMLQRTRGFPRPVAVLRSGPVWSEPTLLRFLENWQRRPGRPSGGSARMRPPDEPEEVVARVVTYERMGHMAKDSDRHVVPDGAGGWNVQKPGASRASTHHDTQADAIDRAREIVHNAGGGEVVIHGRDGRIRDSDTVSPGNDPNPPRDRR